MCGNKPRAPTHQQQLNNNHSPYRHFHGSLRMSPRTALPTAAPGPCNPRAAPFACRSDHICCPPRGTVCSRRSSPAGFVLCKRKPFSNFGSESDDLLHLPELLSRLETLVVCDREHAEESLATPEIVVPDRCIVLLASSVQYVYLYFFAVQYHLREE